MDHQENKKGKKESKLRRSALPLPVEKERKGIKRDFLSQRYLLYDYW
jgi:hypothetical protein